MKLLLWLWNCFKHWVSSFIVDSLNFDLAISPTIFNFFDRSTIYCFINIHRIVANSFFHQICLSLKYNDKWAHNFAFSEILPMIGLPYYFICNIKRFDCVNQIEKMTFNKNLSIGCKLRFCIYCIFYVRLSFKTISTRMLILCLNFGPSSAYNLFMRYKIHFSVLVANEM